MQRPILIEVIMVQSLALVVFAFGLPAAVVYAYVANPVLFMGVLHGLGF